ncbi:Bug family tripartite tricarboxylate transporter substrate binding protein [Achromobacter denitrificans]
MKYQSISRLSALAAFAAAMALGAASPAQAADYPNKPITLVVPFAPGGSTDILGRLVADELRTRLGQSVVVENRSGANGNIGTALAARAAPDGYTLLMANAGTNVVNPSLYKNLTWDPIKDFTPLAMVARVDNVVVVGPTVKAESLKELADYAQANPGALNYGSVGVGSIFHLAGVIFSQEADVKMTHVAYRGANPALTDLISGNIQVMFATIPGALPFIKAGRLNAVAVTGENRSSLFPDLPTAVEAGFPKIVIDNWFAVMGPAGLPDDVKATLMEALTNMQKDPKFQAKLKEQGAEPGTTGGKELERQEIADIAKWKKVVTTANITID